MKDEWSYCGCLTPGKEAEKATILHSWTTLVGPLHGDGTGLRTHSPHALVIDDSELPSPREPGHALHLGTRELADLSTLRDLPVHGSQPRVGHHATLEGPQALLADGYARYKAFRANAGREVHLGGFNVTGSDLVDRLVEMAARGNTDIFLKVTLPKFGIFRLTLGSEPQSGRKLRVAGDACSLAERAAAGQFGLTGSGTGAVSPVRSMGEPTRSVLSPPGIQCGLAASIGAWSTTAMASNVVQGVKA